MEKIRNEAFAAAEEIIRVAGLKKGDVLVVGCSTSEVISERIGTNSSPETAEYIYKGIAKAAESAGVFVAAQCCEHLSQSIQTRIRFWDMDFTL